MPKAYLFLVIAIAAETIGTTALTASQQFTRPLPTVILIVSYALAFYLLSLTLRTMPVGIVYAIWSGLGIALIAAIGYVVFGQKLDLPAVIGMAMILGGILVIHLFSDTGHSPAPQAAPAVSQDAQSPQ
ncbi:Multidrug transporter EmrE [Aquimixticola soesokkakensis]|uniref:Multidrug transporter EmrE n=1 Tax=Aquimixticola soesokkakensis TaxID=1519096 RepID=A0A1Y5SJZ6_9RHOB|nr:multidrug efflux SMR transporter [Aquimixticola soesokkakensis]SLN42599.1 Multidrug transporter EmrE [Aquimixticola soesokkakensis]